MIVEQDGRAGEPLEPQRAAHMVDVSVSEENLLEREAQFGEPAMNVADLVAGINDDGLASLLIAEYGAVGLQRANGKALQNHGFILQPPVCGR